MPKPPSLERVKKLAKQLSSKERELLFEFLAALPDSGMVTSIDPPSPPLTPEHRLAVEKAPADQPVVISTATWAAVFLKERAMFQVFFYPLNFRESRVEIAALKLKDNPPAQRVIDQLREIFRLHSQPEPPEENVIAATKQAHLEVETAKAERYGNELSARLPHMAYLLYEGGVKIVEIAVDNDFSKQTGQRQRTLKQIVEELGPFWKHIKAHLNLTPGGMQHVKHQWSVRDYTCLAVHYDRLKPIWREAKKAAKQALAAKEASRRRNWVEQVDAAYKEEKLPIDLVKQLAPSVNSQPADLALLHASRLCLPAGISYSTKVLKQKLRHFNPVSRTSPKKP